MDKKNVSFLSLKNIKPITEWDDLKVGETYHIPPLIYNKRFDFVIKEKKKNCMRIIKEGSKYSQTIFRTDITSRFIVKKEKISWRHD